MPLVRGRTMIAPAPTDHHTGLPCEEIAAYEIKPSAAPINALLGPQRLPINEHETEGPTG
jgi:hypothetical protein